MASLAELSQVYAPSGREAGFSLADIELQSQYGKNTAAISSERLLRNYNQFDLPALLGQQAARGAFRSSATTNKRTQMAAGVGDQLSDIQFALANQQARLASNALLAQTGISLGSM